MSGVVATELSASDLTASDLIGLPRAVNRIAASGNTAAMAGIARGAVTDAELIGWSLDDREVFGQVFDRHYARVHQFIRLRLGLTAADDLAAETFCTAFQKRHTFDLERPDARPWLFGIAMNLMRRQLRSETRKLRAYARHGAELDWHPFDGLAERVDADRDGRRLADGLARLGKGDRDVLLLHAWAELAHGEIAEALDIPVGTVKSRLARARRQMAERVEGGEG